MRNNTRTLLAVSATILASLLPQAAPAAGASRDSLALGIDRSNLSLAGPAVVESSVTNIRSLGATWFRDGFNPQAPRGFDSFVDELRDAKHQGLKLLVILNPVNADFDFTGKPDNAGGAFLKHCGWAQGSRKLGNINLQKYTQRLHAEFQAMKAAGIEVDAFEIGNELDNMCFNGDVPNGREANEQDVHQIAHAYGAFLKTSALAIRAPGGFPRAQIITFGIQHGSDKWDNPPHHISDPARIIAALHKLDGFDYLDNAQYHVDGYGTHVYAWPNDIQTSILKVLQGDEAALGREKPFWVTEWGFLNAKAFPTQRGETLSDGMNDFLRIFQSLDRQMPIGPVMFYSYDNWLADANGQLKPSASTLRSYAASH